MLFQGFLKMFSSCTLGLTRSTQTFYDEHHVIGLSFAAKNSFWDKCLFIEQ